MIVLFLSGCASTHSLLIYKIGCQSSANFLSKAIEESDFQFKSESDYSACKDFQRYKIVRKNIDQEHLDGHKFRMETVEQIFCAKYDKSRCELAIVTPLSGRVKNTEDSNHILNKYYYAPLVTKIANPKVNEPKYSTSVSFPSERDFRKFCQN